MNPSPPQAASPGACRPTGNTSAPAIHPRKPPALENKNAAEPGAGRIIPSKHHDAVGFQPLLAVDDLDPHALAGLERGDAAAAQRRHMDEDVLAAAIGRDEAIAPIRLEPFHHALEAGRGKWRVARAAGGGGAVVDGENGEDERPARPHADLADDRSALARLVEAGAAQGRHGKKGVRRAIRDADEPKALGRVEPLDLGFDAASGW